MDKDDMTYIEYDVEKEFRNKKEGSMPKLPSVARY